MYLVLTVVGEPFSFDLKGVSCHINGYLCYVIDGIGTLQSTYPVLSLPALSHISKIRAQFASPEESGVAFSTEDAKSCLQVLLE